MRQYLNSSYIDAANKLAGRNAVRHVVVYVESYDDILFWSTLLRPLETEKLRFEVHLPSHNTLNRGKKQAMANELGPRLGQYMIACVDADYDFLQQGHTPTSHAMLSNPYVFHTYAYAIENFQCFAPTLRHVTLLSTLCDAEVFPFEQYLTRFSRTVWPLFVWNVWSYRYGRYKQFSLTDFSRLIAPTHFLETLPSLLGNKTALADGIEASIQRLRSIVNKKISHLQRAFPEGRETYKPLRDELLQLGLTPESTYLYMRGHDVFEGIVLPLLTAVSAHLRRRREREIRSAQAQNPTQRYNELSSYQHTVVPPEEMLRKHTGYITCPLFLRIQKEITESIGGA